jgi:hypothetical protein
MSVAQALSPELVLVGADLRAEAIAALPARPLELYVDRDTISSGAQQEERSALPPPAPIDVAFVAKVLVYCAWHALLGALLGVGIVVAVALGLLVLTLLAA